jgi:hypothetical protein
MTRRAWLLALLAVLVRAGAALNVRVIDSDSTRNLQMASLMEQGRFGDALRVPTPTPPLHPFLASLLKIPLGSLLIAGVAVSVLLGGFSVLPLYAMALRSWDEGVAVTASLLYAFLPAVVDLHAEAMTEATFMFFFLGSMALGWRAIEENSWELTVVAAGSAALAWYSRPEGIYLLPLFGVAALLRFSPQRPPAVLLFAGVWFVLAFPYLCFIHAETGHWQVSLSPYPQMLRNYLGGARYPQLALQDYSGYRAVVRHGVFLGGGGLLLANFFGKVLWYVLGPFLVLGFFRPRPAVGGRALLAYGWIAAAAYLFPVALSFLVSTPFSHRFLLVPAALLLPTAAAGLARAAEWTRRPRILTALVALMCVGMGVRDLRPRRADKLGCKEAGLAIKATIGPGRRIYSTSRAVEFYAGSEHLQDPGGAEAFVFCMPELRAEEKALEQQVSLDHALLGEFPSPARPGILPVRVYVGSRSP